jgi:hypothetical protein
MQPEPDAKEDESHPEKTTHWLEGWRAAEEGQTGTRTHIIIKIKREDRVREKGEAKREGIR